MSDVIDNQLHRGAQRVIGDLRELAALTSTPNGAQRVAWGPVWSKAREWLRQKVSTLGLTPVRDAAGNDWITLPGESARSRSTDWDRAPRRHNDRGQPQAASA